MNTSLLGSLYEGEILKLAWQNKWLLQRLSKGSYPAVLLLSGLDRILV